MSRTGENIFKRKDGRWEARYIHHYEDGKPIYRYIYAESCAEARAKKQYALSLLTDEAPTEIGTVFSEVAHLWLDDIRDSVKESTYTRYHRIVEKYLLDKFGEKYIHEIDHFIVNEYTEDMLSSGGIRGEGMSPKTVTDILCVLKAIIKFSETSGYMFGNTAGIRLPQKQRRDIKTIDSNIVETLTQILMDSDDLTSIGILFSLYTGLRIGEVCGLRWCDVDAKRKTLSVSRTVERIADLSEGAEKRTKVVISEADTESSSRVIPLPSFLSKHLEGFRTDEDDYVLTGSTTPIEPYAYHHRYKALLRTYGLKDYSFNSLRHTFATRCVEQGFDTKVLSEILGHANVSTTLELYVNPSLEQKRSLMEKLVPSYSLSKKIGV